MFQSNLSIFYDLVLLQNFTRPSSVDDKTILNRVLFRAILFDFNSLLNFVSTILPLFILESNPSEKWLDFVADRW